MIELWHEIEIEYTVYILNQCYSIMKNTVNLNIDSIPSGYVYISCL